MNREGVRALLRSSETEAYLAGQAQRILDRVGPGYEMDTYVGRNRCNAMVWADSTEARRENARQNTLLKAMGR